MESLQRKKALNIIEQFVLRNERKVKKTPYFEGNKENSWTLTQLHILMSIEENIFQANNTFLSNELQLSKPAITKAVGYLIEKDMIRSQKKEGNQKSVYYTLTNDGQLLVTQYKKFHERIKDRHKKLLSNFTDMELELITVFLCEWIKLIRQIDEESDL